MTKDHISDQCWSVFAFTLRTNARTRHMMILTIDNQFNIVYVTSILRLFVCVINFSTEWPNDIYTNLSWFNDALEQLKIEGKLIRTFPVIPEDHSPPHTKSQKNLPRRNCVSEASQYQTSLFSKSKKQCPGEKPRYQKNTLPEQQKAMSQRREHDKVKLKWIISLAKREELPNWWKSRQS